MDIHKHFLIANSLFLIGLSVPSTVLANDCVKDLQQCVRSCQESYSDFRSSINCQTVECTIDKVCKGTTTLTTPNRSTPRSPAYTTHETERYNRYNDNYGRYEPPSQTPRHVEPSLPRTSSSRNNRSNQDEPRSRADLKRALTQKGGSEAKRCITTRRAKWAGVDNTLHLRNSCSKRVKVGWCNKKTHNLSRSNSYKCDANGKFSYSAATSVGPFDERPIPGSYFAAVKYGVCMETVTLDGKSYSHIATERKGETKYSCNYSTYGR